MKRIITAIIVLPLLYLYVTRLPGIYFASLMALVSAVAVHEFLSMYGTRGMLKYCTVIFAVSMEMAVHHSMNFVFHLLAVSAVTVLLLRLFLTRDTASSLKDVSPALAALVYVSLLLGFQVRLRDEWGVAWILFMYGSIWASDSAALYIGKAFGKRKLYPSVSPNKTVAGAVASLMGGAIAACAIKFLILDELSVPAALILGFAIGGVTILGDLVESMFKRDAGVKDSGVIFPGHGGILDKIDGALLAGPVLYWILSTGLLRLQG